MRTNAQRPLQKKRSQINARMQTQKKKKNTWRQIKRKDKFINATAVHTCWSLRKWWWQPLGSDLGEFQPWLHACTVETVHCCTHLLSTLQLCQEMCLQAIQSLQNCLEMLKSYFFRPRSPSHLPLPLIRGVGVLEENIMILLYYLNSRNTLELIWKKVTLSIIG